MGTSVDTGRVAVLAHRRKTLGGGLDELRRVATARGALQWARTLGRMAAGRSEKSPFVRITQARSLDVRPGAPMVYELDGGARGPVTRLKAKVVPGAITVCVPDEPGGERIDPGGPESRYPSR